MKTFREPRPLNKANDAPPYTAAAGASWYTELEWAKVKATAEDPERFEPTYPEWAAVVEAAMEELRQTGISPEKVLITADELLVWCRLTGKTNNGGNRAQFVSEKLRNKHEADIN